MPVPALPLALSFPHAPADALQPRQRLAPLAAVLLVHAVLAAAWWTTAQAPQAASPGAAPSLPRVQLLPLPTQPAGATRAAEREAPIRPRRAPAKAPTLAAVQTVPQAITAPTIDTAAAAATPAEPSAPAAASPAGPAASAPRPLDLSLPRQPQALWRQRPPALDDPRSNTRPPASVEARIAAALGDGTWQVERLDLDTVRFRSGSRCLLATRSRAGQLELAGGAFRETWGVRDC